MAGGVVISSASTCTCLLWMSTRFSILHSRMDYSAAMLYSRHSVRLLAVVGGGSIFCRISEFFGSQTVEL